MEKITDQISSRAAILLGRESVSKVDGAIIELVKNTYDADASFCLLAFDIEHDAIYIIDNGTGMTRDTIQNCWMLIGTDNKRIEYQSKKNRIKSGEKGIGRFALDRLGAICEMYTKHESSNNTLYWKTDWRNFEESGKTINEVAADIDFIDSDIRLFIPHNIVKNLDNINEDIMNNFTTGTILKITNLRDNWSDKNIDKIFNMLSYSIPNTGIKEYSIYVQKSYNDIIQNIKNEMLEEFDYKLEAKFDGTNVFIKLFRNEFNINIIPDEVFDMTEFKKSPYRKDDFIKQIIEYKYTVDQIINSSNEKLKQAIHDVGSFNFEYYFLKNQIASNKDRERFFYKELSKQRKDWLSQNAGIKIYRDNFIVRPYGDVNSDAFDWLNLDGRRASSPAGAGKSSGGWKVGNKQGYGNVYISRINNEKIIDKSSREGIIDNEYFTLFKQLIIGIISILENDRSYIARGFDKFYDKKHKTEQKIEQGKNLAKTISAKTQEPDSEREEWDNNNPQNSDNKILLNKNDDIDKQNKQLAEALLLIDEENEELLSDIKMLRSLITNGLVTTAILHDLMGINADLKGRIDDLKYEYENNNKDMVYEYFENIKRSDLFMNSWITVVISQLKKQKRKKIENDIYAIVKNLELVLKPILEQKNISLSIIGDYAIAKKEIYAIDIESIICNLVINSIEAFNKIDFNDRKITIEINNENENIVITYIDNGPGISKHYTSPYEIFKLGVTDKRDNISGEIIGTGLGMYLISTIVAEYGGEFIILDQEKGFGLKIIIPIMRK